MPSCAPDRWNDSRRTTASATTRAGDDRRPPRPRAARRSTATSANSTATKNAVARMSRATATRPSAVPMAGGPPSGSRSVEGGGDTPVTVGTVGPHASRRAPRRSGPRPRVRVGRPRRAHHARCRRLDGPAGRALGGARPQRVGQDDAGSGRRRSTCTPRRAPCDVLGERARPGRRAPRCAPRIGVAAAFADLLRPDAHRALEVVMTAQARRPRAVVAHLRRGRPRPGPRAARAPRRRRPRRRSRSARSRRASASGCSWPAP